MALDDTTGLSNGSGDWQPAAAPVDLTDIQSSANIRSVVSSIIKMQKDNSYEMQVREAVETNLPNDQFRLVESLYESLMKIEPKKLMHSGASLLNAIAEDRPPTDSDDVEVLQIQNAIPEMIEEGFLPAIADIEKPSDPAPVSEHS